MAQHSDHQHLHYQGLGANAFPRPSSTIRICIFTNLLHMIMWKVPAYNTSPNRPVPGNPPFLLNISLHKSVISEVLLLSYKAQRNNPQVSSTNHGPRDQGYKHDTSQPCNLMEVPPFPWASVCLSVHEGSSLGDLRLKHSKYQSPSCMQMSLCSIFLFP